MEIYLFSVRKNCAQMYVFQKLVQNFQRWRKWFCKISYVEGRGRNPECQSLHISVLSMVSHWSCLDSIWNSSEMEQASAVSGNREAIYAFANTKVFKIQASLRIWIKIIKCILFTTKNKTYWILGICYTHSFNEGHSINKVNFV